VRIRDVDTFRVPPRWLFVRVRTDDGATGWGEAIVPKRAEAVVGAVRDLAANLAGEPANRIEDLWQRMHRGAFFRGGPILSTAAAAVEHALWDLKARAVGLPVHELLGGPVRERTRAYAWVGGDRPQDVADQAAVRVQQGFGAVKMNATAQLDYVDRHAAVDAAVARVASIRQRCGPDLDIALDFHGRVHRAMARALLRELEPFHLMWVEEPGAPECEDDLRLLARAAGATPIATGERLTSRFAVKALLHGGAVDVLQPDVSLTGLFELEKVCRMAEAYDVAVAPHCPNGPISLAASLQVGACCGNVVIQEQSLGMHYHQGYDGLPTGELFDYLADPRPLEPREGAFARLDGPGLGIEVDEQAVRDRAGAGWRLPDPVWRYEDGRLAEW
jgi:galactonate dehydratase